MPVRTLIEMLHIVAGLMVTAMLVETSAWSYPLGRGTIEGVGWVAAAVVVLIGIGPLRRAWREDHASDRARADARD